MNSEGQNDNLAKTMHRGFCIFYKEQRRGWIRDSLFIPLILLSLVPCYFCFFYQITNEFVHSKKPFFCLKPFLLSALPPTVSLFVTCLQPSPPSTQIQSATGSNRHCFLWRLTPPFQELFSPMMDDYFLSVLMIFRTLNPVLLKTTAVPLVFRWLLPLELFCLFWLPLLFFRLKNRNNSSNCKANIAW